MQLAVFSNQGLNAMASDQSEPLKGKILIVDNAPERLRSLSSLLAQDGYHIKVVADGHAALSSLKSNLPDALLLTSELKDMSSFEVCQVVKNNGLTKNLPVIFLSSSCNTVDKVKAFEVGAVDFIAEPWQIPEVAARLEVHIQQYQQNKQLAAEVINLQNELHRKIIALESLQQAYADLERLSRIDGLTKLVNRDYFKEHFEGCWRQMLRESATISLLVCGIDDFFMYKQAVSPEQADECIQKVAHGISVAVKRPADTAARIGDWEFGVILPKTDASGAMAVAKHIRRQVTNLRIPQPTRGYITLSVGVSSIDARADLSPDILLQTSHKALGQAQTKGGDQIIFKQVSSESE